MDKPALTLVEGGNISKSHLYQRHKVKLANATIDASRVIDTQTTMDKSIKNVFVALYWFSNPYASMGTALSVFSISLVAVEKLSDLTPLSFLGVSQAIIAMVLLNMYVAGINQLTDIEIDKVNKPYLPLASGKISIRTGMQFISLCVILLLMLIWNVDSWPLKLGVFLDFVLGTVYSVNTYVFGRPTILSKHIIFVSGYTCIHALVFALFKDIPDVEGDRLHGVKTFAMLLGETKVFWICIWLLEIAYGVAILIGLSSPYIWIKSIMVVSHSIFGFILWKKANLVDVKNTKSFYFFLWKLYYVEYLLLPIMRF